MLAHEEGSLTKVPPLATLDARIGFVRPRISYDSLLSKARRSIYANAPALPRCRFLMVDSSQGRSDLEQRRLSSERTSRRQSSLQAPVRVAARLLHKGFIGMRATHLRFVFFLQTSAFWSGAEGIRTPDLRRAKADCPHPILSHYVSLPGLCTRFLVSPKRLSSHCVPSRTGPVAVRLQ